jgi:tetratricopeptide (TPR) repeat protein
VVFEDIHWAEPTFLDLIEHVVTASNDAPVLIVCSARHDLIEERPEWAEHLANARRIELSELSATDSAAVLQNLLGDSQLPEQLQRKILSVAGGNPLFVEQLLSMLVDEGVLRAEQGVLVVSGSTEGVTVPDSISALLASRLDRLAPRELAVITRASIVGLEFEQDDLHALAPQDEARETIPAALATLEAKRLVRERRPVQGWDVAPASLADVRAELHLSYEFAHILVHNAAYERLLKRSRAVLHQRFADCLIERAGSRVAELEEIIGYHLEQSYKNLVDLGPINDDGRVLGRRAAMHLASAGSRAFARGDMPAAASLLQRATALLDPAEPLRTRLLMDAGEALTEIGELERADVVLSDARDSALLVGDLNLARATRLAHLQLRYTTDPQSAGDRVLDEVESMLPALEAAGDDFALARAQALLTFIHMASSRSGAAAESAARGITHATAAGDDVLARRFLGALPMASLLGPTPVDQAIGMCETVLARAHDHRKAEALAEVALGHLEAMRGNFDRARQLCRHSRAALEEFGWRLYAALTSIDSADVELLAGDLGAAEAELRKDFASLEAMGERNYISTVAGMLGDVLVRSQDLDGADRFAHVCEEVAAPDDVLSQFLWRSVRGRVLARRGDLEEGARLVTEALRLVEQGDQLDMQGGAWLDVAEVQERRGDLERALDSLHEAARRFDEKGDIVMAERARQLAGTLRSQGAVEPVATPPS